MSKPHEAPAGKDATHAPAGLVPDYGIDGPGFVRGFALSAAVLTAAGVALVRRGGVAVVAAVPVLLAAAATGGLGAAMATYAFVGKHRLRDHLLRQRVWRGDETVLDIGAGRGLMAVGAAHRAPAGRTFALDVWSAKDLTRNTPDGLRENAAIEGVAHAIEIVHADARALPFADASIDVVTSVLCIHNVEPETDHARVCAEIARVLVPGGTALIADFPGVDPYVEPLRAAGLDVSDALRAEPIALSIAGYLVATKP